MEIKAPIQKLKRCASEIEAGIVFTASEIEASRFSFESENGVFSNFAASVFEHPYISSHRYAVFSATVLSTPYREPKGTQRKNHEVPA